MSEPVEDWASVADAAEVFGVSERAIQKRCHKGTLAARQTLTPQGMRWEIDPAALLDALNRSGARTGEPLGRVPGRERTTEPANGTRPQLSDDARNQANRDANGQSVGRESDANREAELKEEVHFLRGVIEQQGRDAAELRAALREALKLSAKALPEGRTDDAQSAPDVPVNKETGAAPKTAQHDTQREPRPLWKVILGIR
jgi:hypothetical protein